MSQRVLHCNGKREQVKIPHFPEFKLISLEDQGFISEYINKYPSEACEINFGNIFIWRNFEHSKFTIINNNLCILCEPPSEPAYFLQPLGEFEIKETIKTCFSFVPRLSRIPESFVTRYCGDYRSEPDRNNFDYVYLAEDLIHLKGKKYDGKRNRMKKFEKSHNYLYLRLSPEHMDDCRRLFEEWYEGKSNSDWIMRAQKEAILDSLLYFEALSLTGGAIEVDGRIAAFSIGERLNKDTAVVHFEIASPKYLGLPQLINREFIKNEWSTFRFINREQDLGIAGLRGAKASYYPHHMVKKFNIWA